MNWPTYFKKSLAVLLLIFTALLSGCSFSSTASYTKVKIVNKASEPFENLVISQLEDQYLKWKNTPYAYGGMSKKGIDCSALMLKIFKEKFDINLPRTTLMQAKLGTEVSELAAGDLLFFKTGHGATGVHVGVYYKNGLFMHASSSKGVVLSRLDNKYWQSYYWTARRIIEV